MLMSSTLQGEWVMLTSCYTELKQRCKLINQSKLIWFGSVGFFFFSSSKGWQFFSAFFLTHESHQTVMWWKVWKKKICLSQGVGEVVTRRGHFPVRLCDSWRKLTKISAFQRGIKRRKKGRGGVKCLVETCRNSNGIFSMHPLNLVSWPNSTKIGGDF